MSRASIAILIPFIFLVFFILHIRFSLGLNIMNIITIFPLYLNVLWGYLLIYSLFIIISELLLFTISCRINIYRFFAFKKFFRIALAVFIPILIFIISFIWFKKDFPSEYICPIKGGNWFTQEACLGYPKINKWHEFEKTWYIWLIALVIIGVVEYILWTRKKGSDNQIISTAEKMEQEIHRGFN